MKRTVALVVVAMASIIAIPAMAQTTAPGPYYAWPAWDQQLQCDAQASCPRFIVLANWRDGSFPSGGAAVLDRETGLVWERSPSTTTPNWLEALIHCNITATGNRSGWRLPTLQELASLVDRTISPSLPPGNPFSNVQSSRYWSATRSVGFTNAAWDVNFLNGNSSRQTQTTAQLAWCVRGGQGVEAQ